MNTFELNKTAGAFLGTLLFAMALDVISGAIFSHVRLAKPGYPLPSAQESARAGGGPAAPSGAPIEQRLAKAEVQKGAADTKPCQACHNFEKGAGAKIGPPLYGAVGRPKGSIEGFNYSDAIKAKGGKWTYDDLDQFLANPKAYMPGTKMAYAGETDPAKRADIIAYLHTLSDNPEPLPEGGHAGSAPAETPLLEHKGNAVLDNPALAPEGKPAGPAHAATLQTALPRLQKRAAGIKHVHRSKLVSHAQE